MNGENKLVIVNPENFSQHRNQAAKRSVRGPLILPQAIDQRLALDDLVLMFNQITKQLRGFMVQPVGLTIKRQNCGAAVKVQLMALCR
jgi:hypothetical protein